VTEPRRPILLIANPASGGKLGAPPSLAGESRFAEPEGLAAALRERGLVVTLHVLAEADDPGKVARGGVAAGCDVVAAGGDGTVAPVAAALAGTDAVLGILAMGSWNNIARGTGIPTEPDPAIEAIARGEVVRIDVGLAWHPAAEAVEAVEGGEEPEEPPADAVPFFEAAGVGLDAAGFGALQLGERRGMLAGLRALWRALRRRRTAVRLTVDGRRFTTRTPAVTICNGPYHGMGFALAPDADPTDGVLDVVVFSGMSALEVVRHFMAVARGGSRHEPRVRVSTGRRVTVAGVRRVLSAHADGTSIGTTPVAFAVRPGALRLFR
jgi:diacylglycerol kinase family enzyme